MKIFTKILIVSAVIALLSGCSYHQEYSLKSYGLSVEVLDLKGTQARVYVKPVNDMNFFSIAVYKKEAIDSVARTQDLVSRFNHTLDSLYSNKDENALDYLKMKKHYEEEGHQYIGDYRDFVLLFAEATLTLVGLTPQTDYYVVGACINPETRKVIGQVYLQPFRTTEIVPDASAMDLRYMVHDTPDAFYYYAKPTFEGRICRDFYLYSIVSKTELDMEPYRGDIVKYARKVYNDYAEAGILSTVLQRDISRQEDATVHLTDKIRPKETYIIFGAPFNLKNMDRLFTYTFTYIPGMSTKYTNDQLDY